MAVSLGYKNVYRYPEGYPQWSAAGLPTASESLSLKPGEPPETTKRTSTGWGLFLTLIGVFAGGMALNLTPCVYPMIPVTISYFAGRASGSRAGTALHALFYVFGLSVMNTSLGASAALTGGLMGRALQHPAVPAAIAAVLLLFSLSLFGFWEIRTPYFMNKLASRDFAGHFGSLFMGLCLGVVAAPCIGPFIVGLLTWTAGLGSTPMAFGVFFILSLGLGLPLFFLALFSGQVKRLPKSGLWMIWVRHLMGWVMAAMAVYYLRPLLPHTIHAALLSAAAAGAGLHLGWFAARGALTGRGEWVRTAAAFMGWGVAAFFLAGLLFRGPGVAWQPYSSERLQAAAESGRPVIIDFSADWCTPCKAMEKRTFHDPEVVSMSNKGFLMVQVDLTRAGNEEANRLLKTFAVVGVPTVVFIGPDGKERKDLRLTDFLPPGPFVARMQNILKGEANP